MAQQEGSQKTVQLQEAGTVFATHADGHVLFSEAHLQGLHSLEVAILHSGASADSNSKPVRTRFNLILDLQSKSIARAVTVLKERCYSTALNNGALYKDGLDIRTLTELIAFPCFAEDGAVTDSSTAAASNTVKGEVRSVVQSGTAAAAGDTTAAFKGAAVQADKLLNLRDGYAVQTAPAAAVRALYGDAAVGGSSSAGDSAWAVQVIVPQGSTQQVVTCVFDGSALQSALYAVQQAA
jgi:hypothetical protein